MTKVTDLVALSGASVDTAADLIPVLDVSEAGNARNKKMTFAEFLLAQREGIQDLINSFLVAGTNVTLTYDDAGNILTIDVGVPAPGDITGLNEAIDDRVAALITAGSGITKAYNDGAGTLTLTATAPSGGMVFKGALDCSANPNYPAALTGESYVASVAGKIGGASGESVDVGDLIIATADNAGGTEASVGASWIVLEKNLVGAATAGAITGSGLTMATSRILGRATAATGAVEELTLSQVLDLIGSAAQGDILYRGSSGWSRLGAGTSGHFLKTQGAAADPVWAAASGGGGGSALYRKVFGPVGSNVSFPAANFATLDTRNTRPCFDFDGTTSETVYFSDCLPASFGTGGVKVVLQIAATSATSGDCKFEVAFERLTGLDLDGDSFATAKSATMTVNGTSGVLTRGTITFSNSEIDALVADDGYRMKVTRLPADAADTVNATDVELYLVAVEEQ